MFAALGQAILSLVLGEPWADGIEISEGVRSGLPVFDPGM